MQKINLIVICYILYCTFQSVLAFLNLWVQLCQLIIAAKKYKRVELLLKEKQL